MLIGIVGFAGSGKGTIGDILVNNHDFTRLSFADAVKDAVSVVFGWPRHLLEGDTDESRKFRECRDEFWSDRFGYEVTPRLAMQLMGTESGRSVFHDDIWVHTLEKRMKYKMEWEFETDFVIPDVRFPNEIKFIRDQGGFVIRVVRGEDPMWYETALWANREGDKQRMEMNYNVHYSEWAWIGEQFDYLISNNGSLSMLKADVGHMKKVFTGPINSDMIRNTAA
jgi:hypothetical protein